MQSELTALQNLINTGTSFVVAYGFQIIGAIIILLVGFQLARWVAGLMFKLCERQQLDITLAKFFANVTRISILAFVVLIALGKFGITIAPFIAALGAIAFGSSLAIQGPLSNYGAGFSIILGRPFVIGNTITVQGVSGVVDEIKLAATLLSTEDGEQITIPNKQIVGEILHNSYANKVVETNIGISYEDDPEGAIEIIRNTLSSIEGVVTEPAPQIGIADFGDSAIVVGLRYWVPTQNYFQTLFAANQAIYAAIRRSGISLPYPKREVQLLNAQA